MQSIFNYPLSNDFTVDVIISRANQVYEKQNSAFCLTLDFGLILVNTDSGEYRYFTPYPNEAYIPPYLCVTTSRPTSSMT